MPKCKDVVGRRWTGRKQALDFWRVNGTGAYSEEYGAFSEYPLSFDYVWPGTFPDDGRGFWRYQISWGGPADEIRFYVDPSAPETMRPGAGLKPTGIHYWFLDWFDGASLDVTTDETALFVWREYLEAGAVLSAAEEAARREAEPIGTIRNGEGRA